ncbi:MAG TPA: AraC family transcriptional regulator [Actinomycetales bacterium]|jgi:AraC family cel operon transcriptional repressor
MATLLRWRDFAAGRPMHAALVPVTESRRRLLPHSHADFHELVHVRTGSGTQHVNGAAQAVATGDLVLVRPHDVHEFTADDGGMTVLNVAFASERWHAFLAQAAVPAAAAWETSALPVVVHDAPGTAADAMSGSLSRGREPLRALDLFALWTAVIPALESSLEAADERPRWLVRACASMYDEQNLRGGLPRLRDLASVSAGHLARSMTAYVGCSPVEFVNRVRLDHATSLLATTDEPIGAVAQRCGFTSHAYFCGRFRDRFGLSPRAYRDGARRAVVP